MSIVVNIIGEKSNVGKTIVMEGVIKELKKRGLSIATIKHDVHGFDIDKEGKDTYKHRKAGSETVIISSNERMALIKEVKEEIPLIELINLAKDKDVILVEGYKNSNLRKLEILIAIVSDEYLFFEDVTVIKKNNFKEIVDLILKEDEYKI